MNDKEERSVSNVIFHEIDQPYPVIRSFEKV